MNAFELLFSPATQLCNVQRYSGIYLQRPESVSDHVFQVGIIALILSKKLEPEVSLEKVAMKALVHDLDEALMCDIPRNIKYKNKEILEQFRALERSGVQELSRKLDFPELFDIWKNSKNSSKEGLVVALSDMLQVAKKVIEEVRLLNNLLLVRVADEIREYLSSMKSEIKLSDFTSKSKEFLVTIIDDVSLEMNNIVSEKKDDYERLQIRRV